MGHRALFVILLTGMLFIGAVTITSAHDTETVNGYEVTFGGADEPVITDERMWLEVGIVEAETDEPVEGLEDSLTIAVQRPFGNDTHELELGSRYGAPGWYEAQILFTEPGTYTIFINGTINGTEIDLSFQKQVHNANNLEYPPQSESPNDTGSLTDGLSGITIGAVIAVVGMTIAFVAGRTF